MGDSRTEKTMDELSKSVALWTKKTLMQVESLLVLDIPWVKMDYNKPGEFCTGGPDQMASF